MAARQENAPQRGHHQTFSVTWIVAENLLHLSTWVVAGALVGPIRWGDWPVVSITWAAVVVVVQVLLKKHNCAGCYYYGKTCHLGQGKVAAWLFERDSGDLEVGKRLSLFYVLSPPIFALSGVLVGVFGEVGAGHWLLLGAYLLLNALSFPIRARGCGQCVMCTVCPGSAAKAAQTTNDG